MECTIRINMDGAAFEGNGSSLELARTLSAAISMMLKYYKNPAGMRIKLYDINGNACGTFEVTED